MPQTALKTVPPAAQIGLADADTDFAPSDDDLLNSGFVYSAWLEAGGEPEWLTANATKRSASFVFQEWLKSGGEPAIVRDALRRWMRVHGKSPSARYVRQAWLDAGGSVAPAHDSRQTRLDRIKS